MKDQDKIEVIVGILADAGKYEIAEDLMRLYDNNINQLYQYRQQLSDGRDYLMNVETDKITVEDSLEAFGFGRNGLNNTL